MADPRKPNGGAKEPGNAWRDTLASPVAILVLIGFAAMAIFMLSNLGMSDLKWDRATLVYTSVEAIAFAAAGYFFGKEVHRERAETAEQEADQANTNAQNAASDAASAQAKGVSLRAAIDAFALGDTNLQNALPEQRASIGSNNLSALSQMARELFP
jgi:hypothetical protein